MKKLLPIICVLLASCAGMNETKKQTKLYVFECGKITVKDISLFSPGVDKGVEKKLTNSCYLIKHALGTLVWDTGLPDGLVKNKKGLTKGAFHLKKMRTLTSQLKEIGVEPSSVDYVAFSHFHFDHTGNANLFKNSKLIIQEVEFNAAFGKDAAKMGFKPKSYNKLNQATAIKVNGDHDVFGDGQVIIKSAPGHTIGHQVLFIDLYKKGPIVLSGDLYHFTKNRKNRRVPSFNYNKKQTLHTMDLIENFVNNTGAEFWIQHDLEFNQTIKHSPKFYQ
ncbi:hypothetical protein A9Q84_13050 [Halobacteriovorax marinus]|uniref:Metallo-beta-lactamase domain-containing protein n=1 Tax=Halobacteriovorax marinus TaxID=97084 RepID=A0A1Y5F8H5_9BACT|nr:hypothetical protein A9Q84_13050 [Halobacteriovorax marinus]